MFPILLCLLFLANSSLGCSVADWWDLLQEGDVWATCDSAKQYYMRGLYRSEYYFYDGIFKIEEANCCSATGSYVNEATGCVDADWTESFDG